MRFTFFVPLMCLLICAGCAQDGRGSSGDADSDSDSDADIDTDTDADVDTDTDGDTDSETEEVCVPNCDGKECGPDECGGLCLPGCDEPLNCNLGAGLCEEPHDTDCPLLSWVELTGGTFDQGSEEGDVWEIPVHTVTVPDFEILETEVTVAQYELCVLAGACFEPSTSGSCTVENFGYWGEAGFENHPVSCVDWYQSVDFCTWVSARLPTESEWEFAARGRGQDIRYPWGIEISTCEYSVMNEGDIGCGTGFPFEVCSIALGHTDDGLCDMSGNLQEWVQDWYHLYEDDPPTDGSANEIPVPTGGRVYRGGGYQDDNDLWLTATYRNVEGMDKQRPDFGFRCAR